MSSTLHLLLEVLSGDTSPRQNSCPPAFDSSLLQYICHYNHCRVAELFIETLSVPLCQLV